jgi:hypothetical protein
MEIEFKKLNRFTTIPFLIDLLKRKKLTLLNPTYWEDYNDRATIKAYQERLKKESIYALCLTHQNETIHHWNAFANGTSGCCIEFSPEKLFDILSKTKEVIHGKVEYIKIKDLPSQEFETAKLPYLKREPYKPENEYRIIALSDESQKASFDILIDLSVIRRITISNKIPESVFESTKEMLLQIAPELKNKIFHSTLYNNSNWIKHFKSNAS